MCSLQFSYAAGAQANIFIGSGKDSPYDDLQSGSGYKSSEHPVDAGTYDEVYGGKVEKTGGSGIEVKGNELKLDEGHTVNDNGKIYGGYYKNDGTLTVSDGELSVKNTGNSVEIDAAKLGENVVIYGGYNYFASDEEYGAINTYAYTKASADASADALAYAGSYKTGGTACETVTGKTVTGGTVTGGTATITYNIEASGNSITLTNLTNVDANNIYGGCNYLVSDGFESHSVYAVADASADASAETQAHAQAYTPGYTEGTVIGGTATGGTATGGTAMTTYNIKASGNSITLTNLTNVDANNIYGGCNHLNSTYTYANASADASASSWAFTSSYANGAIGGTAKGGTAKGGTAKGGTATITYNIEASGNSITLTNAKTNNIYGGYNYLDNASADANASARASTDVSAGGAAYTTGAIVGTAIRGTATAGTATGGTATITYNIKASGNNNSSITLTNVDANNIYGGYNYLNFDSAYASGEIATITYNIETSSNKITLSNVDANNIYGGYNYLNFDSAYASGKTATITYNIEASGNNITLTNVDANNIYGGYNYLSCTYASASGETATITYNIEASNNNIYIYGGSFKDAAVYSGYSEVVVPKDSSGNASVTGTAKACGNTVFLYPYEGASPNLEGAVLWGGRVLVNGEDVGTVSGNTLVLNQVKNVTAANIKNFDKLTFSLPAMAAKEAVLTLTDENGTDISNAEVTVTNEIIEVKGADGAEFKENDEIVLLTNANGLKKNGVTYNSKEFAGQPDADSRKVLAQTGISLQYTLKLQETENSIVLKWADTKETKTKTDSGTDQKTTTEHKTNQAQDAPTVLPGTKAIAEGAAAGLALVSEAANAGIELARSFSPETGTAAPFIHVQGSSVTYETGSSVQLNAVSLIAGIGAGLDTGFGKVSAGAFFEYGKGTYTTSNSFDNASSVNGDGDAWYMGGGILAKMEFLPTGPGHFYLEGSAHVGQLHNEYDSSDLRDAGGRIAKFDMDSPYYSLHGGLGYVWDITDEHELDVYGNYIWTRVDGTDETLTTGDKFEFDDMDSSRVRFGARYTYKGNERFRPYVGVAYEHEFAGSCESTAFGHDVAAPSFEGDTGIGELGITMKPSKDLPLSINVGVQGYVGQKQGVSGNCMFKYEF